MASAVRCPATSEAQGRANAARARRIQEKAFGLSGPRRKAYVQDLASDANRRSFKTGTKIVRGGRTNFTGSPSHPGAIYIKVICTKASRRSRSG